MDKKVYTQDHGDDGTDEIRSTDTLMNDDTIKNNVDTKSVDIIDDSFNNNTSNNDVVEIYQPGLQEIPIGEIIKNLNSNRGVGDDKSPLPQ